MTNREKAILELAVTTMKSIVRLARTPVVNRRGAVKIAAFKDAVAALPSAKAPAKKPQKDIDV